MTGVRDRRMASIVPTMLLHFLRPWRSDGGDRAKQEPEPRATQGAVADDCRARIVPTIPLHFLHPWRSDAGGTSPGKGGYDSRDGGGRAKQEARAESEAGARAESNAGAIAEQKVGAMSGLAVHGLFVFHTKSASVCRARGNLHRNRARRATPLARILHQRSSRGGSWTLKSRPRDAHDYMAGIVPTMLLHFLRPWRSDVGGTTPGKGEVAGSGKQEARAKCLQEQLPRHTRESVEHPNQANASQGAAFGHPTTAWQGLFLQSFASPPSLEVRCRSYDPMASIVPTVLLHFLRPGRSDGRATEPEPRATHGAVVEQ